MHYHFRVHKDGNGFWAECIELDGCQTEGEDLDTLKANAEDALNLYLSEPEESRMVFPLPKKMAKRAGIIAVAVQPSVALSVQLKSIRAKRNLTQTKAANLIGIKTLYTYQKLESPKTSNPELKTLSKLKKAFPELNLDALVS
ncbi:MAG: type II toxin-antitoxin system HicB family antitoxin [Bdellovibrionales bacterium]|nr:type II toxin-antitoxin system HicB family antitoxin [Bdellovibrionales bacterium]